MHKIYSLRPSARFLIILLVGFCGSAQAQKYKKMSDTVKLNKEFAEISLDMAKLNSKLATEKGKTAGYESKTLSTTNDAEASGQESKDQALKATSGNTRDTKKAVKKAKEANDQANDAKDARADEKSNNKKISDLSAQIQKKQRKLDELGKQKTDILNGATK